MDNDNDDSDDDCDDKVMELQRTGAIKEVVGSQSQLSQEIGTYSAWLQQQQQQEEEKKNDDADDDDASNKDAITSIGGEKEHVAATPSSQGQEIEEGVTTRSGRKTTLSSPSSPSSCPGVTAAKHYGLLTSLEGQAMDEKQQQKQQVENDADASPTTETENQEEAQGKDTDFVAYSQGDESLNPSVIIDYSTLTQDTDAAATTTPPAATTTATMDDSGKASPNAQLLATVVSTASSSSSSSSNPPPQAQDGDGTKKTTQDGLVATNNFGMCIYDSNVLCLHT